MNAVNKLAIMIDSCEAADMDFDYDDMIDDLVSQVAEDEGLEPDVLIEAYLAMIGGDECDEVV